MEPMDRRPGREHGPGGAADEARDPAEEELRRRVLAGDRAAAEAFFRAHVDAVYEFAHYRLDGDRSAVEDVVQDTFLAALGGLGGGSGSPGSPGSSRPNGDGPQPALARFDGESSVRTWLCGIAKNKIRALRRKRRPRALSDVLVDDAADIDAILARVA